MPDRINNTGTGSADSSNALHVAEQAASHGLKDEQGWIHAPSATLLPADTTFKGGLDGATASDFWQWGFSDLRLNIVRGIFAEFLVAKAVGDPADTLRDPWANFDVRTLEGVTIEVKSSAYLQAWPMKRLTTPTFTSLTSHGDAREGKSVEREVRADVFVFCLHTARSHAEYDPLDVTQWKFWVMSATRVRFHGTRQVGLTFVKENSPTYVWSDLREAVLAASSERDI